MSESWALEGPARGVALLCDTQFLKEGVQSEECPSLARPELSHPRLLPDPGALTSDF